MCLHGNTCTRPHSKCMVVIVTVICLIIIIMQYSEISKLIKYQLEEVSGNAKVVKGHFKKQKNK